MIHYRPTDGDVHGAPIRWLPRTCFIMAQLGRPIPDTVTRARAACEVILRDFGIDPIDADGLGNGPDFLLDIWHLAIAAPIGLAIVHQGISHSTMANIFYELGWMQCSGKETVIVRTGDVPIPSDLAHAGHIDYDHRFEQRFREFLDALSDRAEHFLQAADRMERNPLLAIDYLRRAYLLTGNESIRDRAARIRAHAGIEAVFPDF